MYPTPSDNFPYRLVRGNHATKVYLPWLEFSTKGRKYQHPAV